MIVEKWKYDALIFRKEHEERSLIFLLRGSAPVLINFFAERVTNLGDKAEVCGYWQSRSEKAHKIAPLLG
jgi:hypothetical protein